MRPAAALGLALAMLALAGCSSPGADAAHEAEPGDLPLELGPEGLAGGTAAGTGAATDTLYLAPPARLNATNPSNLTILATLSGAFAQSVAWNTTLNGTGNLT